MAAHPTQPTVTASNILINGVTITAQVTIFAVDDWLITIQNLTDLSQPQIDRVLTSGEAGKIIFAIPSAVFPVLEPATAYKVFIAGRNEFGTGPIGTTKFATTGGTIPPEILVRPTPPIIRTSTNETACGPNLV